MSRSITTQQLESKLKALQEAQAKYLDHQGQVLSQIAKVLELRNQIGEAIENDHDQEADSLRNIYFKDLSNLNYSITCLRQWPMVLLREFKEFHYALRHSV